MRIHGVIGTVGGVGYITPAPGTWGSAAAVPLAWVLHTLGSWPLLLLGIALVIPLGVWAIGGMTRGRAEHDPSEAVIDEVAGQWIALLPVSFGASFTGADVVALWPGWVTAFAFFRLFDIMKPGPVGYFDRQRTPLSTVLDDVVAGVFAALTVIGLAAIYHFILAWF